MTRGAGKKEPEAMPPQAAKWAETLPYHAATIDLLRRGTALSGDTTMVHGDVRTCSRDRKPSERNHRPCLTMPSCSRDRKRWMRPIRAQRPSWDTMAKACGKEPHQPERKRWGKSWTRRQELHDPGYYAAFPWGVTRGKRGTLPRQPTPP